jgi:dTDP-4-dehydrorhamnose reductase
MFKKILFTGGDGNLCLELKKLNLKNFIFFNRERLDITDYNNVEDVFINTDYDIIVHTAALTRPMIIHDENPFKSIETNIIGTSNIVIACIKFQKKIIYISTDYVYGPGDFFEENSSFKPCNKYSWSKLGGECAVMMHDDHLILRVAMTQFPFPHKFAYTNIFKSSIWIDEMPEILLKCIDLNGILNIGNQSQSIYDFVSSRQKNILPKVATEEEKTKSFSISMDLTKLNNLQFNE